MDKSNKKYRGFSLSEAIITIVVLGIIASIVIPQILLNDPSKEGKDALAKKMTGYLTQASTEILINDASLDDFTRLKDNDGYFSIIDKDVTPRIARLYQKYLKDVDLRINTTKDYFSNELIDYDGTSTGLKLNSIYSDFFYMLDGMIIGFRLYESCDVDELNSIPPTVKERYTTSNSCGSVFFDINAFSKPNKLGTDQFIIPIGKRGIKYE